MRRWYYQPSTLYHRPQCVIVQHLSRSSPSSFSQLMNWRTSERDPHCESSTSLVTSDLNPWRASQLLHQLQSCPSLSRPSRRRALEGPPLLPMLLPLPLIPLPRKSKRCSNPRYRLSLLSLRQLQLQFRSISPFLYPRLIEKQPVRANLCDTRIYLEFL